MAPQPRWLCRPEDSHWSSPFFPNTFGMPAECFVYKWSMKRIGFIHRCNLLLLILVTRLFIKGTCLRYVAVICDVNYEERNPFDISQCCFSVLTPRFVSGYQIFEGPPVELAMSLKTSWICGLEKDYPKNEVAANILYLANHSAGRLVADVCFQLENANVFRSRSLQIFYLNIHVFVCLFFLPLFLLFLKLVKSYWELQQDAKEEAPPKCISAVHDWLEETAWRCSWSIRSIWSWNLKAMWRCLEGMWWFISLMKLKVRWEWFLTLDFRRVLKDKTITRH